MHTNLVKQTISLSSASSIAESTEYNSIRRLHVCPCSGRVTWLLTLISFFFLMSVLLLLRTSTTRTTRRARFHPLVTQAMYQQRTMVAAATALLVMSSNSAVCLSSSNSILSKLRAGGSHLNHPAATRSFHKSPSSSCSALHSSSTIMTESKVATSGALAKLSGLRQSMAERNLDVYIVPSDDPHLSEYTPLAYQRRGYLTNFHGSAGTAVVTPSEALLWTDSR